MWIESLLIPLISEPKRSLAPGVGESVSAPKDLNKTDKGARDEFMIKRQETIDRRKKNPKKGAYPVFYLFPPVCLGQAGYQGGPMPLLTSLIFLSLLLPSSEVECALGP